MSDSLPQPIIFHYEESIYAHKILWYFALRGISYAECIVLNRLPRPTLASLGVTYRRIPVLALGRDVYVDTRLISRKLSVLYPPSPAHPALDPPDSYNAALASIIGGWTNDGGVFWRAVSLLPAWRAWQMKDPEWLADRKEMTGLELTEELMAQGRPEGLAHMRIAFDVMENGVLADGREWVLGTKEPTTADIEAVYPFEWLVAEPLMEGALPADEVVTRDAFPRTWAWVERFLKKVKEGEERVKVTRLTDEETIRSVSKGALVDQDIGVDAQDPLKLKSGQEVKVYPSDTASYNQDFGKLIGLSKDEIVIENEKSLRIHFPRWNFRIEPVDSIPATVSEKKKSKMRYLYHPLSPYSRKAYMVAIEVGIADRLKLEKVVVAPVVRQGWSDNVKDVAPFNPIGKIPTLIPEDDPEGIFDSRTICDYLEAYGEKKPKVDEKLKWKLRTTAAAVEGTLDAQVLIIYEMHTRPEEVKSQEWIDGQNEKIKRGFDYLESAVKKGEVPVRENDDPASIAEVAIAACCGFFDFAGLKWRDNRPKLDEWFEKFSQRDSYQRTRAEINWETGKKIDLGFASGLVSGSNG